MENITNLSERIRQFIDYKGFSVNKFSISVGASNSYFNKILKDNNSIGSDRIEKILRTYPEINPEWLLLGSGSMLKNDVMVAKRSEKGYPLVVGTAIGGLWNDKTAIEERDVKDYYVIPKFQHKKVDFMIEVEGSSMYPKYSSGDVVACRVIKERNFIQWNKTHVVATKNQGIIIKRIKKGDCDENLLMVSDNKDYDPFFVPIDEIVGLALVVGVVRLE